MMETEEAERDFEAEEVEEMEEDEQDDDDDDDNEGQLEIHQTPEEGEKDGKKKGKKKKAGRTSLSGRGVTLKMLLDDGVLAVEEGCMSIDYLVCYLSKAVLYRAKNTQVARSQQTSSSRLVINKSTSGCICMACDILLTTSLLQVFNGLFAS